MHFPRRSAPDWTHSEKRTWRREADSSRSSHGTRHPFSMQRRFRCSRTIATGPTHSRSRETQHRGFRRSRNCRTNERQIHRNCDTSYRSLGGTKWSNRPENYRRCGCRRPHGNHQSEIRRTRGNSRRQSCGIRPNCGNSCPRRHRGKYCETHRRAIHPRGNRHRHGASRRHANRRRENVRHVQTRCLAWPPGEVPQWRRAGISRGWVYSWFSPSVRLGRSNFRADVLLEQMHDRKTRGASC
jgi:hypothetical protein